MESCIAILPCEIDLRFISFFVYCNELLLQLVDAYVSIMPPKVNAALGASLKLDRSIDIKQLDNEHVMAHIIPKNEEDQLTFLGFNEP